MGDNKLFEIICQHKDSDSSNLNKVFESYGCDTLEAKVPVVEERIVEGLMGIKSNQQQFYANLTLKASSSSTALQGKGPRTKNRPLKVVRVGGETIIATGELEEREPVDEDELDQELDDYMRERARLKALKESLETQAFPKLTAPETSDLDQELDEYMRESARLREQKKTLENIHNRDAMEEDFEVDYDIQSM